MHIQNEQYIYTHICICKYAYKLLVFTIYWAQDSQHLLPIREEGVHLPPPFSVLEEEMDKPKWTASTFLPGLSNPSPTPLCLASSKDLPFLK